MLSGADLKGATLGKLSLRRADRSIGDFGDAMFELDVMLFGECRGLKTAYGLEYIENMTAGIVAELDRRRRERDDTASSGSEGDQSDS